MPALPFPSGPSSVVQPHAWQIFHFRFWMCFLKEKSIMAKNVSKSGAPRVFLKRRDKPATLFSYYILSVDFLKKCSLPFGPSWYPFPHPTIAFCYPLWWLSTFDKQESHSSPQMSSRASKIVSNVTCWGLVWYTLPSFVLLLLYLLCFELYISN